MYTTRWVDRDGSDKEVIELSGDRQVLRTQEAELLGGKIKPEIQVVELFKGGLESEI